MSQLLKFLTQSCFEFNKLYIGQLPLSITQQFIRDNLSKFTQVRDVRIIKGDARGSFDRFCYAFAMVRGTQQMCNQIIKKVNEIYPQWKINVKIDNDRLKYMQPNQQPNRQNVHHQNQFYPPQHIPQQQQGRINEYLPNKDQQPHFYDRQPMYNPQQHYQSPQSQNYPPSNQPPFYDNRMTSFLPPSNLPSNSNLIQPQKIVGEKHNRILVRQIWLGGIPQMCDKFYMEQLMSEFGIIQNLEIFPKFAFIKFKMVDQATIAFERAQRIYNMFGNPPGFRIKFSDPSRRANIVSNNYQFDRQSPFLPILFLGFPPVTSANIDLDFMKSICEKYGQIVNSYMRKNSNNSNRSYFLFTYDNVKSALRAKAQLNKRRDLLGDKRVEVTLLIDEEVILRGRDLSHTQRMFQGEATNQPQKKKTSVQKTFPSQNFSNYPPKQNIMHNISPNIPPFHGGFNPNMYPPRNYMVPLNMPSNMYNTDMPYGMPPNYPESAYNKPSQFNNGSTSDVHQLLQSVFQKTSSDKNIKIPNYEQKPMKNQIQNQQSVSDILNKMLGSTQKQQGQYQKEKQRQPTWSGFMTWKGLKRVGVDGHTQFKQPQDYAINIMNLIEFKDVIMKQKATMILQPSSSIYQNQFKQYIKALRSKVGVSFTANYLMYVMSKSKQSDEIKEIKENQLLVIMEKTSLGSLIRDKLQKCQELK